ncbi:MAG: MFS transporter [Pseudomonadales bacterium]|nr:MFS transporter [Pseudomonadales bacterium]
MSPVIVTGLAQSGALDRAQAGYVFSCNMLGTALGGLCIIFFVHRLNWRRASAGLLVVLIVLDLISATVSAPMQLYVLRFAHGLAGGILIGVAMSVIARMVNPERTVALFIMLQLITGGAFTLLLAPLLASPGTYIVWLSLAAFSLLSLLLLPLLGPYPVETRQDGSVATEHTAPFACILFAMIALFIYQCGEMAAFAYVIELGFHYEFNAGFTGTAVAASLWIGGPAALFVTWWSTRSGRLVPFLISGALMVCSIALLLLPIPLSYLLANIGFGIFFSISFPYLMGIASEMDNSGRMGTAAGFAGNLGLAAGPTIAGFLVGENQFERVLMFAIAAIAVSMMLATGPARMLDRRNRTGRVVW